MCHRVVSDDAIEQAPDGYLAELGRVFAVSNEDTQDSGNISYGVEIGRDRYFVKTAGRSDDSKPALTYGERVSLLRNAARLRRGCDHPALPRLHRVIESPGGPMLVYQWAEGEQVRPSLERIRRLPALEIVGILDTVYQVHDQLAASGWIASGFYDGAMIYDFDP